MIVTIVVDFPSGSMVKNLPAKEEMQVWSLGQQDPPKEEVSTYSSSLAWKTHGQRSLEGYSP